MKRYRHHQQSHQIGGLPKADPIYKASFIANDDTSIIKEEHFKTTDSKYEQDLEHIMSEAHRKLQDIEQTSREVQNALTAGTESMTLEMITNTQESEKNDIWSKAPPTQSRRVSTVKVVVNNIAGVDKSKQKLEVILNNIRQQNINIFLGQEMNIQTRDKSFIRFLQRKETRDFHFATSESSYKFHSYKKPGGTFCITGSRLKPRIMKKVIDHMGRWAGCIYQLKGVNVAFISIYHTVENTYHGPNSIHSQQLAILLSEARDITPRQAWQQDMIETIRILQAQHVEVVIAGDFNSSDTEGGIIKELCMQCNLEVLSRSPKGFSSYRQGKNCIDHVLGSVKIAQAAASINYEEYPDTYYSDHTPICLQFNLDTLRSSYIIGKMQRKRRLYSKDHGNVREYVRHKATSMSTLQNKRKD